MDLEDKKIVTDRGEVMPMVTGVKEKIPFVLQFH